MKSFPRLPADHSAFACLALCLFALATRLPYSFAPRYDWDESTFIVMGNHLLHGHLPYVDMWDNKPPGLFIGFALLIALGRTIAGIRLLGALLMGVSAMAIYLALKRTSHARAGLWAGCLLVASAGAMEHALMAEHMSCLPLSLLALLCSRRQWNMRDAFVAGLLVAMAGFIRTNLFALLPGVALIIGLSGNDRFRQWLCLAAGAFLPVLVLVMVYGADGELPVLWPSLVASPLQYAVYGSRGNYESAMLMWAHFMHILANALQSPLCLIWYAAIGGLAYAVAALRMERDRMVRMAILLASVLLSVLLTGARYNHYLIQVLPLSCLFAGLLAARLSQLRPHLLWMVCTAAALFYGPLAPVVVAYGDWPQHYSKDRDDPIYQTAEYLNQQGVSRQAILACDELQILYFLTDTNVPLYVIHPSNWGIPLFINAMKGISPNAGNDLNNVLDKQPLFVVSRNTPGSCIAGSQRNLFNSDYVIDRTIGSIVISRYTGFTGAAATPR